MKAWKTLGLLALSVAVLTGCGKSGGDTKSASKDVKWPTKSVNMIVPWKAGGDTDIYARLVAKKLSDKFKQTFVVVNTPGGTGIVGSKTAMTAKPDGYTVLFGHSGSQTVQQATKTVDFDFNKDFATAGTVIQDNTYTVVAKKEKGWKDLKDFIAYAKANPGKVRYSQVYGTITHYVGAKMEETMGIKMNMLDVGAGGAERLAAFMGDQVDVLAANYLNVRDYIEKGDFVVLGVCADQPMASAPNLKTFKSQGYDISFPKSYEVKFPKGTDPAIVSKMSSALEEITKDPDFKSSLEKYCAVPVYRSGEQTVKEDTSLVEAITKAFAANK
jgi:tripartite-type tricarboxylate transporter receptor subunit TctC